MRFNDIQLWLGVVAVVASAGCASGGEYDGDVPWSPGSTVLIGAEGPTAPQPVSGDGQSCILGPDETELECEEPRRICESDEAADVIVDENGRLLDVVCYPPKVDAVTHIVDGEVPQNANNAALVVGDDPYEDDLHVEGNNFVLWGDDPDVAVLDGDLSLSGNNAIVRGITITGNVEVTLNNAIFVYCRIEGNLRLTMNNARVSGCEILGDVIVGGHNVELYGNRIHGDLVVQGQGLVCDDNWAVSTDEASDEPELAPLSC